MDSWCKNMLVICHDDRAHIDALERALTTDEREVFPALRPRPARNASDWWEWNERHWGTKFGPYMCEWRRQDQQTMRMGFETAASPPIALYEYLVAHGWKINAYYVETSLAFCGMFTTEGVDLRRWTSDAFKPLRAGRIGGHGADRTDEPIRKLEGRNYAGV